MKMKSNFTKLCTVVDMVITQLFFYGRENCMTGNGFFVVFLEILRGWILRENRKNEFSPSSSWRRIISLVQSIDSGLAIIKTSILLKLIEWFRLNPYICFGK